MRRANGAAFPRPRDKATLYLPNGPDGPVFLLLKNFRVIKRYNNSNFYALAVGHLSDQAARRRSVRGIWPAHEKPFTLEESKRLQLLLTMSGYYSGDIDGDIGSRQPRGDPQLPAQDRPQSRWRGDPRPVAAAGGVPLG